MANMTKTERDAYIENYDRLAKIYRDPMEVQFSMMANELIEPGVRRAAASDLMSYRYPKTKAIDIQANIDATAGFSFAMVPNQAAAQTLEDSVIYDQPSHVNHPELEDNPPDYIDPKVEFSKESILR